MADTHLVTGFPSFLGKRVVSSILEEDADARALCLVLPEEVEATRNEVRGLGEENAARVEILVGRESSMHLGLSSAEYRRLREEGLFIHHLPRLPTARGRTNDALKAVENVLELAGETPRLERLIHYSPAPPPERGALLPPRPADALRWRIDARLASTLGRIPSTLFRAHRLLGDSRTGEFVPGTISLEFAFRLAIPPFPVPLPSPGFDAIPFQAVPTDWAARSALRLARRESTLGEVVHLIDPDPVPLHWVWREVALRLGRKPWEPLLWLLGAPLLAGRLLPLVASAMAPGAPTWKQAECVERCPSLPTYLDRLLRWAREQILGKRDGPPPTDLFA